MLGDLGTYLKQRDLCLSAVRSRYVFDQAYFLLRIPGVLFSDYHLGIQLTFSSPQNFHKTRSRKEAEAEREAGGSEHVLNMRGCGGWRGGGEERGGWGVCLHFAHSHR